MKLQLYSILIIIFLFYPFICKSQTNECLVVYKKGKPYKKHFCNGEQLVFKLKKDEHYSKITIDKVEREKLINLDFEIPIEEIEIVNVRRESGFFRIMKFGSVKLILAAVIFNLRDMLRPGFRWHKTNTITMATGFGLGVPYLFIPNHKKLKIGKKYQIKTTHFN